MKLLIGLAAAFLALLAQPACAQSPAASDPAIGLYTFDDGREVYINYLADLDGLIMVEYPSGRLRALHNDGARAFSFGATIGAAAPVVAQLAFEPNAVRWTENGAASAGHRLRFRTEDVSFRSRDGTTLAGTITFPEGRGPFPGVVLMHGGLAEPRENFLWIANFFARRGVAVLAYDKRGSGHSTGDWRSATAYDLADDAQAGLELMRARRDILTNRIGLYGSSAAAWPLPIVATRAPEKVAWIIVRSPTYLPERENLIFEMSNDLRGAGFDDAAIAQAAALHRRMIAVADANGVGWNDLRAALDAAHTQSWFGMARLPPTLPEDNAANRAEIAGRVALMRANVADPAPLWAQIHCPVLTQNGTLDIYTPGIRTAEVLMRALDNNPNALVRLYPRGDHGIFESEHGYGRDIPNVSRYAPGFLTDMDAFIARYAAPRR